LRRLAATTSEASEASASDVGELGRAHGALARSLLLAALAGEIFG